MLPLILGYLTKYAVQIHFREWEFCELPKMTQLRSGTDQDSKSALPDDKAHGISTQVHGLLGLSHSTVPFRVSSFMFPFDPPGPC